MHATWDYGHQLLLDMLEGGLMLQIQELLYSSVCLLDKAKLQVLFGSAAQYGIMPFVGAGVSKALGLSPELSAGVILLSCCPGGTASNVVSFLPRFATYN
jgi:BASS family bile acid:Na+ symporter